MKDPLLDRTVANRFAIRSRVGEGGMSVVYLAKDLNTDSEVAIKVLHRHLVDSEEFVARFKQEARTAGQLRHPNAVQIVDSGVDDDLPYIAMEYCAGRSLKRIIREEAPLEPGRAADLASQILDALAAAHEVGIIHRDLKPENVRVAVKGGREVVKVLDFGVAKFVGTDEIKEMTGAVKTKTGIVFGTPKYMAPEQSMGEEIDSRIDVYAAGVILFEMLAGVPPFESDDLYGYVTKHLHQPAPPIREKVPDVDVPEALERVVLRALSKKREERPDDAGGLVEELSPFVVRTRTSRWRRQGPGAAGLLLGGLVGGAAAYALAVPGPGRELAVASASVGLFGAIGFVALGRTASRNLVLRLLLVLGGAAVAQAVLWIVRSGDGVWNAASALVAAFVFILLCTARGLGRRLWRPVFGLFAGAAAGALFPVLSGGVYLRLWQTDPMADGHAAGLLASAALGLAIGLGGMIVPGEAPGTTAAARLVRTRKASDRAA
jgi:hypothetical protein